MTSREKVRKIFDFAADAVPAFWTGNPHHETYAMYKNELGQETNEQLFVHLRDDCRWLAPWNVYKHPEGKPMFDYFGGREHHSLGDPGVLGDATTIADVEAIPWPDPAYLDFSETIGVIREHQQQAVFTGMWCCFFHDLHFYFGMENYFIKMYTHPEVVEAATEKVLDFYLAGTEKLFCELGDLADIFFFGNDFGSQLDMLCGPAEFKRFVLPGFTRFIELAHKYNKKAMLHSCGAISKVIPWLIDAGMDGLHPLQARAVGMDAATLAREYKGKIVFMGGVDTQHLLIHATPAEVKEEVRRIKDLLGPHLIVSPSHEAILPDVPPENVQALAEAALL
jgi:uroporphyrinogen decarboxylase